MEETDSPVIPDKKLENLKKIVSHCCLLISVLAFQYLLLGFCSLVFGYSNKGHLIVFALISGMQMVCAPLGYIGVETANRQYLLILVMVNIVWIISTLLMFVIYWIIMDSPSFDSEIALHVGGVVFLGASILLSVATFMLMRKLDMVSHKVSHKHSSKAKVSKH